MMMLKRAVITGIGAITPIGNDFQAYWGSLLKGVSGAARITLFDPTEFKTQFACEIKNYDSLDHFDRKEGRKLDRCAQLGIIAAREAVTHSKILDLDGLNKDRVGVIWGSGIGGIQTFEEEIVSFTEGGFKPRFNPFFIPKMIADITPGHISMEYGFRGPNFATVSACASSTNAIIDAYNYIRLGKADAFVVGGSEAAITRGGIGGFNSMHALSVRNDSPQTASRPFDKGRDGFVMGEGSGCFVLEEYDHAVARGATIYAEVIGAGMSADAHHLTAPHPEGIGAYNVMKNALDDAGISVDDVDHINMHGTSTPLGDIAESKAIVKLFESSIDRIAINSTKSMTGHLLGAAGIIESIACVGAIMHNEIPPTINLEERDDQVPNMNIVFNKPLKKTVRIALNNTFGFGGHNASVIFKNFNLI